MGLAAFAALAALAAGAEPCPTARPVAVRGVQASIGSLGTGGCYVSIRPMRVTGMVYRDYAFYDSGMLLAFNSYGQGGSEMTSGREFRFFPRRGLARLDIDHAAQTVAVIMSDGARVEIHPDTAQLSAVDRGEVKVAARVHPDELGGVEFPRYAGLMLDSGYRRGELPSGRPQAVSTFRDAAGRTCAVGNRELFEHADGNAELRFDDAALAAWLKSRCPAIEPGF